ncbi:MAG: STAS domain-containing protein [Gammaproteobacteria bacterium]|nr:STAS domain-containing protein [Gammaproteobacteria bacterium]
MNVYTEKVDDKTVKINISGTLGNQIQREFRAAYEQSNASKFIIDVQKAPNIDSSGLGMLLLLRDFAGGDDSHVEILNCSDHVLDILKITNFEKLFKIPQVK